MNKVGRRFGNGLAGLSVGIVISLLAGPALSSSAIAKTDDVLASNPDFENIGELVTQFIQKSHYSHIAVDDALSAHVMDHYIEALDGNRMYLLASDIDYFNKYRTQLDDMVRDKPMDPVFELFSLYRTRVRERLQYALTLLDKEPDFTTDEQYPFDRKDAPWAKSKAQLNDIWRLRVKNDALSLELADKTWEETQGILQKRYARFLKRMDQVKSTDVFETFMNALAHTLDPHSGYLGPRNSEEYQIQMSLSYFGIGASLQTDDDYVQIVGIIPGGPAAIDGKLKQKDRITGVAQGEDGKMVDVIGWRLDDVVDLIRGPANTVVKLQVVAGNALPGSSAKTISLTRDRVKLENQAAKSSRITVPRDGRDWQIGVIDVPSFYRDYKALSDGDKDYTSTTKDVKRLIDELEKQGIDGLVMDLRGDGGGHLTEATALSGLFIENGPVVQLRNANGRVSRLDDPNPVPNVAYNGPMVVLVDRFSASASEIFAAAIQDYHRGVIVGQRTYGKGTVQNLYSLDQYLRPKGDDSFGQLTLTIGKFYRVTGASTQHRGVEPDIKIPSAIDTTEYGESTQDTALPWDTVQSAHFKPDAPLQNTIQSLTASFDARSKADPNFQFLEETIQDDESLRGRTSVSLNLADRRAERKQSMDQALAHENERRKALHLEPVASLDDLDDKDRPDVPLDEAAGIVTDLAILREVPPLPAQTAQIGH